MDSYICVVAAAVISALVLFLLKIATVVWWKPLQIKSYFERQGIRGPPYRLLYGNAPDIVQMTKQANATPMPLSHHIIPRVLPHYHHWTQTYGRDFVYWFGPKARLNVAEPELMKEILSNKFGNYEKLPSNPLSRQLVGQGLVGLKGQKWTQHRRIISPAFRMELLKLEDFPSTWHSPSAFLLLGPFGVGKCENGKFSYGYSSFRGKRASMEDFHETRISEVDGQMVGLFGVFDGHGGSRAAEYVKQNLFENLVKNPNFVNDTKAAIVEAYKQTDTDYLKAENGQHRDAGSTASTVILVGGRLLVANVGDSRVVACRAGEGEDLLFG